MTPSKALLVFASLSLLLIFANSQPNQGSGGDHQPPSGGPGGNHQPPSGGPGGDHQPPSGGPGGDHHPPSGDFPSNPPSGEDSNSPPHPPGGNSESQPPSQSFFSGILPIIQAFYAKANLTSISTTEFNNITYGYLKGLGVLSQYNEFRVCEDQLFSIEPQDLKNFANLLIEPNYTMASYALSSVIKLYKNGQVFDETFQSTEQCSQYAGNITASFMGAISSFLFSPDNFTAQIVTKQLTLGLYGFSVSTSFKKRNFESVGSTMAKIVKEITYAPQLEGNRTIDFSKVPQKLEMFCLVSGLQSSSSGTELAEMFDTSDPSQMVDLDHFMSMIQNIDYLAILDPLSEAFSACILRNYQTE